MGQIFLFFLSAIFNGVSAIPSGLKWAGLAAINFMSKVLRSCTLNHAYAHMYVVVKYIDCCNIHSPSYPIPVWAYFLKQ